MKATSSISASSSDKAFGLSAGSNATGGQTSDSGFLAMLDGMIQTSGTGSGSLNATPDQGKNAQGQADADIDDGEIVPAVSDSEAAQDEIALATSPDTNAALPVAMQQVAQPIILSAAVAPAQVAAQAKTAAPIAASASDDTLATLVAQAGLVPVAQAQNAQSPATQATGASVQTIQQSAPVVAANEGAAAQGAIAATPFATVAPSQTASTPIASAPSPVAASNAASALTEQPLQGIPVASSDVASPPAKAQTAQQSDQDNSDTQQSAILSALFAQAPLQVLPNVSSAEPASAKSVSGISNAGIASVPGVGLSLTLSPPAVVGNGSNSVSAHLLASSSSDDDAAPVAAQAHGMDTALSYGIGTSVTASGVDEDAEDGDSSPSVTVVAATDQVKAETITSLFTAPAAKTTKTDADAKNDDVTTIVPAAADISSSGITLVHQTNTTGATAVAPTVSTPGQAYTSSPADQVSLILQRANNNGSQTMTIALNPIELGKVEVKLDFAKDGSVQASVTAERPETLTMLKNDHSTLTQALHNAGLTTNSSSLSFNLRDGGASQQQQQGFGSASSYRPGSSAARAEADETISPSSITTVQYAVSSGNGRLDVTV